MTLKKVGIVLFLIFSLLPIKNVLAQMPNAGFVPANLWYSEDPFGEGDKIQIYTLVYNPDSRELSCTVIFFDNATLLGTKAIKIPAKSAKDVSINWTVSAGDHTIFAKIENAKFLNSDGTYEEIYLAKNQSEESKRSVAKKVVADIPSNLADSVTNSASDIVQTVANNTPPSVTRAVGNSVGFLEEVRTNTDASLEKSKETTQKEIDVLNQNDANANKVFSEETDPKAKLNQLKSTDYVLKPFKYVELFFLTILSYIFKYAIIFYILSAIVLFLILRFLWRLIF